MVFVGALQIMLDKGKELDWFGSPVIVGLAVVAAIGFAFFLIWELTDEHPIVDLRVFRQRGFTGAARSRYRHHLRRCSSPRSCWCRSGCRPDMGYTASWAGLAWRRSACWRSCCRRSVGKSIATESTRACLATVAFLVFALVLWMRSRFNTQADFCDLLMPDHRAGHRHGFLLRPAD